MINKPEHPALEVGEIGTCIRRGAHSFKSLANAMQRVGNTEVSKELQDHVNWLLHLADKLHQLGGQLVHNEVQQAYQVTDNMMLAALTVARDIDWNGSSVEKVKDQVKGKE